MTLYYYYDLLYYYRTVISNNKTSIGAARKTARRSRENDIVGVVAQLGAQSVRSGSKRITQCI